MDSSVKSACFDEIAHSILDADKKVTAKIISNNWDVSLAEAATVLEEWSTNNDKHKFTKEYLVKGTDQNGNGIITIVPDAKLDTIKKKLLHFTKILHSVELPTESSRKLAVQPEYDNIKMINLPITSEERDCEQSSTPDEPIAATQPKSQPPLVEKKKEVSISSMFGTSSTSNKTERKSATVINDSEESKEDSTPTEKTSPKHEPRTPKKSDDSPTKKKPKESPKSKKDNKKSTPKNSIASFFLQGGGNKSTKPTTAAVPPQSPKTDAPKHKQEVKTPQSACKKTPEPEKKSSTPAKAAVKPELVTPKKKESKVDSLKRSISAICDSEDSEDDVIPTTPQAKPKPKAKRTKSKQNGNAKKRSRIIQNESSDEDDEAPRAPTPEGRKTNGRKSSDIENMDVQQTPQIKSNLKNGDQSNGKKRKAKRTVTRTYEDTDGYFKTVKEIEEYSCSDDDVQIETPIKSPPAKQNKKTDGDKTKSNEKKKTPTKRTPAKKAEKPATKQGSIMNFFSKK